MDRRLLTLTLLLLTASPIFSQTLWEWNYPKPQGNTLRGLILKTDALGIALGDAGTAMRRSSGTFQLPQYPTDLTLRAGSYHLDTMWIVGDSGHIFRSTTNGSSWASQRYALKYLRFDGVKAKDKNTLWVVGDSGYILYSTNGGAGFTKQSNTYRTRLHDVSVAKQNVYACGDSGTLLRGASNGSFGYAKFPTGKPYPFRALDMDTNNIFVVGDSGYILRRSFADESFINDTNIASPVVGKTISFNDVAYYDNYVIAVGSDGTIKRSIDTGWTWSTPNSQTIEHLNQIKFASDFSTSGIAWIVGDGGAFLRSTNFGSTWVRLDSGIRQIVYAADRSPWGTLYVTSAAGIAFRSTTDGATWRRDSLSNVGARIMDIAFDDNGFGLLSTYDSKVLRTLDSGATWAPQNVGTASTLILGVAVQGNTGLASGVNGQMFRTTNKGANWTAVTSSTNRALYDVDMFGDHALAAGDNGAIIFSTDRGATWTSKTHGSTRYNRVRFANSGEFAVAVGQSSSLARTTNHGQNWTSVSHPAAANLNDIRFHDDRNGIIVGDFGSILKTTNTGANWTLDNSHTINDLKGAIIINGTDAFVAGNRTTILYTSNSALPVELVSMKASRTSTGSVTIAWKVARELNNRGFSIERRAGNEWQEVAFTSSQGNTESGRSYYHNDMKAPHASAEYRLTQIDLDGAATILGTVAVSAFAQANSALTVWPNPVDDHTRLQFDLQRDEHVRISLVNAAGVEIAEIHERELQAGSHSIPVITKHLACGLYYIVLEYGAERFTQTLIVE